MEDALADVPESLVRAAGRRNDVEAILLRIPLSKRYGSVTIYAARINCGFGRLRREPVDHGEVDEAGREEHIR